MRYFYLFVNTSSVNHAICFNSKKDMLEHVKKYDAINWAYTTNKKTLPEYITKIIGNGICKDYHKKNDVLVIKDSLKDKKREI